MVFKIFRKKNIYWCNPEGNLSGHQKNTCTQLRTERRGKNTLWMHIFPLLLGLIASLWESESSDILRRRRSLVQMTMPNIQKHKWHLHTNEHFSFAHMLSPSQSNPPTLLPHMLFAFQPKTLSFSFSSWAWLGRNRKREEEREMNGVMKGHVILVTQHLVWQEPFGHGTRCKWGPNGGGTRLSLLSS